MKRLLILLVIIITACCEAADMAMKWLCDRWPRQRK